MVESGGVGEKQGKGKREKVTGVEGEKEGGEGGEGGR